MIRRLKRAHIDDAADNALVRVEIVLQTHAVRTERVRVHARVERERFRAQREVVRVVIGKGGILRARYRSGNIAVVAADGSPRIH